MPKSNEISVKSSLQFYRRASPILGLLAASICVLLYGCKYTTADRPNLRYVSTIAGTDNSIGEPFGIASKDGETYVSDGETGTIWKISVDGSKAAFATGLDTPSAIAFDKSGDLIIADSGTHTIKKADRSGTISLVAGTENTSGNTDGAAAQFNAPIGIAILDDKIYVADTYNDRIRIIENGQTRILAGSTTGFADGTEAKFNTPTGLAIWHDKLLVADTGNNRIRMVEPDGSVWTLAGNGTSDLAGGSLLSASFVQPTAITVDQDGTIFVADGNAIRKIGGDVLPMVTNINKGDRGTRDGDLWISRFNRPSGLAFDKSGNLLVADSENRLVRRISSDKGGHEITPDEITARRDKPEEFRAAQPARWPYDPPTSKRDIAGTLGEVRGEVKADSDDVWFHNGLDIAGAYGETARFVRTERVLKPVATENFNTLRELIRMPTLGYIHIRLGRDSSGILFDDPRFQFQKDPTGKLVNVRVPRGSKFTAGERIGTLNSMNHVHLIAGRTGSEMNALDALILPGVSDTRPPVIEKVTIFDTNWHEVETAAANLRTAISTPVRIVVRTFDQVDGNNERRRLGLYNVGYRVFRGETPMTTAPASEIKFDRMPPNAAVKFVYATGSHSGATGETIFNYIATNTVEGETYREGFLDPTQFEAGAYIIRVFSADYFGNMTTRDIPIDIKK